MTFEYLDVEIGSVTVEHTVNDVTAVCPVDGSHDTYRVMVEFTADGGRIAEAESLRRYLYGFQDKEVTQEELAFEVRETVEETLYPLEAEVTVVGEHGDVFTSVVA